jgi:hypothetical protein
MEVLGVDVAPTDPDPSITLLPCFIPGENTPVTHWLRNLGRPEPVWAQRQEEISFAPKS